MQTIQCKIRYQSKNMKKKTKREHLIVSVSIPFEWRSYDDNKSHLVKRRTARANDSFESDVVHHYRFATLRILISYAVRDKSADYCNYNSSNKRCEAQHEDSLMNDILRRPLFADNKIEVSVKDDELFLTSIPFGRFTRFLHSRRYRLHADSNKRDYMTMMMK